MIFQCMLCSFEGGEGVRECPKHGSLRYRLCDGKSRRHRTDSSRKDGRWSKAMGIHPNQLEEFKKHYPDRVYHPKTGDLWVENYQQHKRCIKENHLVDLN